jgi:hypothetical protein
MVTRVIGSRLGVAICLVCSACVSQEPPPPPPTWDGLQLVEREGLDSVYVRPGASLAQYKRVILRHAEVSFDQNWAPGEYLATNGDEVDRTKIAAEVEEIFQEITLEELRRGAYGVASNPDTDVLRIVPSITDLYVGKRGGDMIMDIGHMTLVVELRDSLTNTALARVIDRIDSDEARSLGISQGISNSAAAEKAIAKWAVALRSALDRAHAEPLSTSR